MRELLFGLVLIVAAVCVVVGVAHYSTGLAWITAGPLLALLAWLMLSGDDDGPPDAIEVDS